MIPKDDFEKFFNNSYRGKDSSGARKAIFEAGGEDMLGMTIGAGMLVSGLAGAGASAYGAWSSGRSQSKALEQAQRNLERDRREKQAAWSSWQTAQEPVFQTRQDALMVQLGRHTGDIGKSWNQSEKSMPREEERMATLSLRDVNAKEAWERDNAKEAQELNRVQVQRVPNQGQIQRQQSRGTNGSMGQLYRG